MASRRSPIQEDEEDEDLDESGDYDDDEEDDSVFTSEEKAPESAKPTTTGTTGTVTGTGEATSDVDETTQQKSDFGEEDDEDEEEVTDTSEDKRPKKPKGPIVKKIVDYTKQNVSKKYLRLHRNNLRRWHEHTLNLLITRQDYAVDSVKLEWLLRPSEPDGSGSSSRTRLESHTSAGKAKKASRAPQLETAAERRRLYNLLARPIEWR